MVVVDKNNIFLCDLEYLGAEIKVEKESGKERDVIVSWVGHEPFLLHCKKSPQGWHVVPKASQRIKELVDRMETIFSSDRDLFQYLAFTKIRESKVRLAKHATFWLFVLAAFFLVKWTGTGLLRFLFMSLISAAMSVTTLFIPREVLRRTFTDFQADEEEDKKNGWPGSEDYRDYF